MTNVFALEVSSCYALAMFVTRGHRARLLLPVMVSCSLAAAAEASKDDGAGADDLVTFTPEGETSGSVLVATPEPRVVWLLYADGGKVPAATGISNCSDMPPKWECKFPGAKSDMDCKKQVQTYLDGYYKDFNVVFTHTKPTSGPYYTVVATSKGWCTGLPGSALGVAPFRSDCADQNGNVAFVWACDADARKCANTIAQEQAHLVGLLHTDDKNDLLYPSWPCACDRFDDKEAAVIAPQCGRSKQNSRQMMEERLGLWTGGAKPDAFGTWPPADAGAEDAGGTSDGGAAPDSGGGDAAAHDGGGGGGGGGDAGVPDGGGTADGAAADAGGKAAGGGGCVIATVGGAPASGGMLAALAIALAVGRRRWSRPAGASSRRLRVRPAR